MAGRATGGMSTSSHLSSTFRVYSRLYASGPQGVVVSGTHEAFSEVGESTEGLTIRFPTKPGAGGEDKKKKLKKVGAKNLL